MPSTCQGLLRGFPLKAFAFWSIGVGTLPIFMTEDWSLVQQNGLFQGYNWIVLTIIVFQAITGLLVGLVMKQADSVLKGFARLYFCGSSVDNYM